MKKILVPTDFSVQAQIAIDLAGQIAKKTGATIKLVHVYEYPIATAYTTLDVGGPDPVEGELAREMVDKSKKQLEEEVKKLSEAGISVEQELKMGNPFINLSEELKDEDMDLVVMGSKGATGLEETLIGSNTEKVVRYARCPVISVKQPVSITTIKNIVFAANYKEMDEKLLAALEKLQSLFGATIHFVRINTLNNFEPDSYTKRRMKEWVRNNKFDDFTLRIYNDIEEEDGIIHYAEEIHADMLALGTHGRTGLGRLFSGSLAEDVVNHSKRPIWTYHMH
jgi:nucleotide-binding universal stress UspA family protein